ncbi:vitellogenin-2-like [Heteronotia binoei]|uniref:vitellogenin-2-like n=1 Tax=Heteronotia binoei TaxID=13085 RepID=UPI00292ED52A|nr:vitellogenin-2-like [Heteronotia binoei]
MESPIIRRNYWLNMAANLAHGALVSRCLSQSPSHAKEILKHFHDRLAEALRSGDEQEIILCLKSLANAAHGTSMMPLEKVLFKRNKYSDQIQVEAVLAIRQAARMDPRKGQELLTVAFMEREYCTLARIMACVSLLEMNISLPLVVTMAKVAANDNDAQFQRFVISHMTEVAGLRVPQYADVSSACKFALKLLKVRSFKMQYYYSKPNIFKFYDSQRGIGFIEKVITESTAKNLFPSSTMLTTQLLLPGGKTNLFEARLNSGILDELLKGRSHFNQKISKAEKVVPGVYPESQDQSISFSMFDKEIAYLIKPKNLSEEYFQPLINKVFRNLQEGISGQVVSPVAFPEIRRMFPNNLGMPLEVGATGMFIADISANVRAVVSPPVDSNFHPSELATLKLSVDINAAVTGHGAISMGIVANEWQRTMEISGDFLLHVPLKATITIDVKDKSYKIGFPPVCKKTELVAAKHDSYLVARNSAEPNVEKKIPLVSKKSEASLQDEHFVSEERVSREDNLAVNIYYSCVESA